MQPCVAIKQNCATYTSTSSYRCNRTAILYLSPWISSCLFLPSNETQAVFRLSGEMQI